MKVRLLMNIVLDIVGAAVASAMSFFGSATWLSGSLVRSC